MAAQGVPQVCRFGRGCRRPDCWFGHPEGRAIDVSGAGAQMPLLPGAGAMSGRGMNGGGGGRGGGGGGSNAQPCRYGYMCNRSDCFYTHPTGRAIDAQGAGGAANARRGGGGGGMNGVGGPATNALERKFSEASLGSEFSGMEDHSQRSSVGGPSTNEDQILRETWFAAARDCTCCKGYIYACENDICSSLGMCTCSIQQDDLETSESGVSSYQQNGIATREAPVTSAAAAPAGAAAATAAAAAASPPPPPPASAAAASNGAPASADAQPAVGAPAEEAPESSAPAPVQTAAVSNEAEGETPKAAGAAPSATLPPPPAEEAASAAT